MFHLSSRRTLTDLTRDPQCLEQLSSLLSRAGIVFVVGNAIGSTNVPGNLAHRIDRFRTDPTVRVLLLNVRFFSY